MKAEYFQPHERFSELIIRFEHIEIEAGMAVIDKHIPDGYSSLVFNSIGKAILHESQEIVLPSHFMVIPLQHAVRIGISSGIDSFIVTCRASMLSRILRIDCKIRTYGNFITLQSAEIARLAEILKSDTENCARISAVENYFSGTGCLCYKQDQIDNLYQNIIDDKAGAGIAAHVGKFEMSPRFFRRHFVERVGVNAKTLARIVRVNHLWNIIINEKATDFQDLVFEGNYFDQAHLIRDFKSFTGETPSFFFRRNLENTRRLSGRK